eukprot:TRINITY_DN11299_c0_g1_i1.p1 TRINITY_DN11299_c0_g1~~TRINITY_DN11299_c0_g1_i1.p1  ORF type:complete len:350 (+),score=39.91 TRINITY_DN11299_c0_g1_i1:88-1137(+)
MQGKQLWMSRSIQPDAYWSLCICVALFAAVDAADERTGRTPVSFVAFPAANIAGTEHSPAGNGISRSTFERERFHQQKEILEFDDDTLTAYGLAAFVIKFLCIMSNAFFQAAPLPQAFSFSKRGDTGKADAAPFVGIVVCGWQWTFYGFFACTVMHNTGFLVLVASNVLGSTFGVYYVVVFKRNCRDSVALGRLNLYIKAALTVVSVQFIAFIVLPTDGALWFSGLVSCGCRVVSASSLLFTVPEVVRTGNSASINLPLTQACTISCLLWIVCAALLDDAWVMATNVLSLLFLTAAFSLAIYFPRLQPCVVNPRKTSGLDITALDDTPEISCKQLYGTIAKSGQVGNTC